MAQPSVAVLGGTGHQGHGLVQRLTLAGFRVIVGSRDPDRAAAAVAAWPAPARPTTTAAYAAAIDAADVVVLAVPFGSVSTVLAQHQRQFKSETLVVDITVPVTITAGTPTPAPAP